LLTALCAVHPGPIVVLTLNHEACGAHCEVTQVLFTGVPGDRGECLRRKKTGVEDLRVVVG
jgi:hypothetical protein